MLDRLKALWARLKPWAMQVTTGFGVAGGFGAATAVLSGQAKLSTMLPVFASAAYLIAHPEQSRPIDLGMAKDIGGTLQAVADKVRR